MQQQRHIDETLKVHDQITWIREMNNIYKAAEEIILNELIHS